ncbi:conjugal transfer protein TraG N-terminal domain-containing protein [Vibrio fluvialis]|nr:conjugal transfer protein TraG N-terminal domain-containing protein [Vibrio fluvialis]
MALPIYVYSSGDVVQQVLNAVTTFINNYQSTIMSIVAMIGVPMTVLAFVQKKSHEVIIAWMVVTLLVPTFLLGMKKDVQIIDASNPMKIYSVTNVPYITSFPSYTSTLYMHAMTSAIEGIFHVNDDESYSRTGMLFGASLFEQSFRAEIQNPYLQNAWMSYVTNCIRPDININFKYSFDDIQKADDILEFLANHDPSPLRGIYVYNDKGKTYYTCKQGLPVLTQMFTADAQQWFSVATSAFDSNTSDLAHNSMQLQNSFDNLQSSIMNISKGSVELTKQIMAINGIQKGLVDATNKVDTWQSTLAFAGAQTEAQSLGFMASTGLWAQKKIPLLHTILTMLIMCGAPIALAIAMLPNQTTTILKNYIFGYFWIASWPIVFAFINFIATLYQSSALTALTDVDGGLTLANLDAARLKNIDAAAISGWLMSLVPVISNYLVKGGAAIMQSSAMQFSGMMSSIAGSVSREIGTGNISLGNTSLNNHSHDNLNGNKRDLASNFNYHGATMNDEDGVVTTTFGDGKDVYNAKPSMSQLPMSLNNADTQRATLTRAIRDQTAATDTARAQRGESISQTAGVLQRAAENTGHTDSQGTGYKYDDSSSQGRDLSAMNSLVNDYAKTNSMTKTQAWNTLLAGYLSGGARGKVGTDSANVGGEIGVKGEVARSTGDQFGQQETNAHRASTQEQFNERLSSLQSATKSESTDHRDTKGNTNETGISEQLNSMTNANRNYEHALNRQKSFETALTRANEHSLGANENLDNEFQQYVEQQYKDYGTSAFNGLSSKQVLTGTNSEARMYRQELAQGFFEEKFGDIGHFESTKNIPLTKEETHTFNQDRGDIALESKRDQNTLYGDGERLVDYHNRVGNDHVQQEKNRHKPYDELGEIDKELKVVNKLIGDGERINYGGDNLKVDAANQANTPVVNETEAFHFNNTDDSKQPNGTTVSSDSNNNKFDPETAKDDIYDEVKKRF